MNKTNVHFITCIFLSIACAGMTVVSIILHWEFWVPPLLIIGLAALWVMHITQYSTERQRENYFLIYAMILVFFHGVHETSLFDVSIVAVLMLLTFTMLTRTEMPKIILCEYAVIMMIQTVLLIKDNSVVLKADTM